jgi:hypothetical protein
MPYPSRGQLSWAQLDGSIRRALLWLNACQLLSRDDLIRIAWPTAISRQRTSQSLQGWVEDGFIVPIDNTSAFMLGPVGAMKLLDNGVAAQIAVDPPAPRVLPGLLLASQIAVALGFDLLSEASIGGFSWASTPFSGDGPRADGHGALFYSLDRHPLRDCAALDILNLALPTSTPPRRHFLAWLILEVDLGTETAAQLEARAERWGEVLHQQCAQMTPGCWPYVLWVSSGGWERANTIWRAWIARAACPLFITTVAAMTVEQALHPWHTVWRDEHGRPRSLNPHAGQEPICRFQESAPPVCSSLDQAIRAWETTQHV